MPRVHRRCDSESGKGETSLNTQNMRKLIQAAVVGCLSAASMLPANAESPWVRVAEGTDGTRLWVLKHNWQGQYRTYETIMIKMNDKELRSTFVADCSAWQYRFSSESSWTRVLDGTLFDAALRHVCS